MSVVNDISLLNEARLLLEVRKYHLDEQCNNESSIDIVASEPNSKLSVLIKILTSSDTISVKQVRELVTTLDDHNYDKIIVFGSKFTSAAEKELTRNELEFFSEKRVISTFDPQNLYTRILDCVDEQCKDKCGFIPKSEDDCIGYSNYSQTCSFCDGNGQVSGSIDVYWQQKCPVCGGTGTKTNHYSCKYRLISDNADYHFKQGWTSLLQNDLRTLLETTMNQDSEDSQEKVEAL